MTGGLTDFLLGRIAEDEAVARAAVPDFGLPAALEAPQVYGDGVRPSAVAMDPRRVLAECEAKREIVRVYLSNPASWQSEVAVRALAAVYADHPDYREEWRP